MYLSELNNEQREELCQSYLCHHDGHDYDVSWGELADAANIVSDDDLEREYGSIDFVPEDFICWRVLRLTTKQQTNL